jgi:hypothetical protein
MGTGFLIANSKMEKLCGVATAAHVIDHAHYWQEPIRIEHFASKKSIYLRHEQRAIFLDENRDTASVVFVQGELPLPELPLELIEEGRWLKVGNEVGWLGFPAISPHNLCFFSGRISCWIEDERAYLVDGVAINGVSGGPVFLSRVKTGNLHCIGVVSAYMPNRATGAALPGLCVVRDVLPLQETIKQFKSLDEAKEEAPPPSEPPVPPPTVLKEQQQTSINRF